MFLSNNGRLLMTRRGPIFLQATGPGGGEGFTDTFERADGSLGSPWTATGGWSIVNGQAVNDPGLEADVVVNGGFDADTDWTKASGWAIAAGVASKTGASFSNIAQNTGVAGRWFRSQFTIPSYTSGGHQAVYSTNVLGAARTGSGTFTEVGVSLDTLLGVKGFGTFNLDDVSFRPIAPVDLMALMSWNNPSRISASISRAAIGGEFGVAGWWDSASNPQSGVLALQTIYGSTGLRSVMLKFVNGVGSLVKSSNLGFLDGGVFELRRNGTTFQMFYRNTQIGTDATITDPEIVDNTLHGIFAAESNAKINSFAIS